MNGLNTLLYRDRRLLFLVLGIILAFAAMAGQTIGRQEDPAITGLNGTILTPYPGAEPSRVEALVTEKIEEKLREIAEIEEITSSSQKGMSSVSVELSSFLPDDSLEQIWSEIRDALADAAVNFPAGVPEPSLDSDQTGAYTLITAITMADGRPPNYAIQRRFAELMQDNLRQVGNTKYVRLFGDRDEEIQVTVKRDRLAALGLSIDQVSAAVERADVKVQAGAMSGSFQNLLVELEGEFQTLQRIRDIPIGTDATGAAIRLMDVADVTRALADPPRELAYANGVPAVLIAARMEDDRQVDVWIRNAKYVIAEVEAQLPDGLEHSILFDQSRYTADRFIGLGENLAIGIGLVILVLFFTLGWRAATVVASIIPLAGFLSVAIMQWLGLPIQQMSVTGLIVALGLLVDAAIVMSDEIRRRLEEGTDKVTAIGQSVNRLAIPLLASTLTTVLAFMPMALLPGPAGDFVGSIAIAVISMVSVSFLLAITVTPAISGILLKAFPKGGKGPGMLSNGVTIPVLARFFNGSLDLALRHRFLSILFALILPLMGFAAFPTLTAQFFPGVDRDQFYIQVTMPSGTAITETERVALAIDQSVRLRDDIQQMNWVIGESAPPFYYNMAGGGDGLAGFAEALVTSVSPEATERLIPLLQDMLDRTFPQAQIIVRGLVQGPPVDAPVEIRLVGQDLDVLRQLGSDIRAVMAQVPEITHTRADLIGAEPKLSFRLDEDKVRQAGLTLADVARQLDAALSGVEGGSLIEATEELTVRIRLARDDRATADALRAITIVGPNARSDAEAGAFPGIPIMALGALELVPSDSAISRRNGERINMVQAFIDRSVLPEEALKKVEELMAETIVVPPGYRLETGGDSDARSETSGNLVSTAGTVVILTLVTIFLTFGSYRLMIVTTTVAFLSIGLSLLALAIFQFPFGILALIGVIGSIGVAINATIIILTALQQNPDACAGDKMAIRDTVSRSARHIVSTTITTVGGFIPLILEGGGFWPPFAMAIAGGVSMSIVLAFYFTPPIFSLIVAKKSKAGEIARTTEIQDRQQELPMPIPKLVAAAE